MTIPQLKKIKYTQCPECACAEIKSVKIEALHTCGEWNEYLEFACGAIYHYFPNFSRVMVKKPCREVVRHVYLEVTVGLHLELRPETDVDELIKDLKIPEYYSWNNWAYTRDFWGGVRDAKQLKVVKKTSKTFTKRAR